MLGIAVAVGCFVRALRGTQEQADKEVYDNGVLVARREPAVRVTVHTGPERDGRAPGADVVGVEVSDGTLLLPHLLGDGDGGLPGARRLVASWAGTTAVVAALQD